MTRFCTLLIILFSFFQTNAQQRFYIFIQTESQGTFYLKKDNKVQNSATGGYLILSDLPDGKQEFSIGFSNSAIPEQHFSIDLKGKDRSFLLKNFDNKGWGLFDLQDLSISHTLNTDPGFNLKPTEDVSPFTSVLVKASGDSTLKYTAVVKDTQIPVVTKKEHSANVIQSDKKDDHATVTSSNTKRVSGVKQDAEIVQNQIVQNDVSRQQKDTVSIISAQKANETSDKVISKEDSLLYQHSKILKVSEGSTAEGLGIVYRDISPDGKEDTVSIVINDIEKKPIPAVASQAKTSKEIKFLDINNVQDTSAFLRTETMKEEQAVKSVQPVEIDKSPVVNNCSGQLTDKEWTKLRNKMSLAVTDETMIKEAQAVFPQKCMTSSQVKRLSELFVTNAGKYSFFKAVYPYVSDKQYFYTLRSELTDEHYNNRFVDIMQSR